MQEISDLLIPQIKQFLEVEYKPMCVTGGVPCKSFQGLLVICDICVNMLF